MKIYCYGDSHTRYFEETNAIRQTKRGRVDPRVNATPLIAASARGFSKGEESRFAYKATMRNVENDNPHYICLNFGQVDAELGYYFSRYVKEDVISPETFFAENYSAYVNKAAEALKGKQIIFKGINPSCIAGEFYFGQYVYNNLVKRIPNESLRIKIKDNIQADDTHTLANHYELNCIASAQLQKAVRDAGFDYFDLRAEFNHPDLDGLVRKDFLPAINDVHMISSMDVHMQHRISLFTAFGAN